jgi:DNA-binding response OmpR family regulator
MHNDPTRQLKAFVVEDQPMVASTLMDALAASGVDVVGHVYDAPAAMAWLDRGQVPDVVLMDVMLPSGPAYPLLDRIRELPTAVLLITGLACDQIPAAYQDLPCLEKPFGVHDLLKAVAALRN